MVTSLSDKEHVRTIQTLIKLNFPECYNLPCDLEKFSKHRLPSCSFSPSSPFLSHITLKAILNLIPDDIAEAVTLNESIKTSSSLYILLLYFYSVNFITWKYTIVLAQSWVKHQLNTNCIPERISNHLPTTSLHI